MPNRATEALSYAKRAVPILLSLPLKTASVYYYSLTGARILAMAKKYISNHWRRLLFNYREVVKLTSAFRRRDPFKCKAYFKSRLLSSS